jgi:hypothetical protein
MQENISRKGAKIAKFGSEIDLLGVSCAFARDIPGSNL